jgi:hypothetical protein
MRGLRFGGVIWALVASLVCVPGALSAAPSYDHFASPAVLRGLESSYTTTNAEATKETGERDHAGDAGGASVWFSWTAPRSGVLLIDTCHSNFDTLLAVYTGSTVAELTEVAANDDSCGFQSELDVDVVEGTDYRIAVDGAGGQTGSIVLTYAMPPPHDDFANATPISGEKGTVGGSARSATHEEGEPRHAGTLGAGSVWYAWTAPGDVRAIFYGCGGPGHMLVAVYTGTAVRSLTPLAAHEDGCRPRAIDFDAAAGVTYWIALDPVAPTDSVMLNWTSGPITPRNLTPPTLTGRAVTNGELVASPGTWAHTTSTSFEYRWFSCPPSPSDAPCDFINTRDRFSNRRGIPTDQFGRRIKVEVIATGRNGFGSAYSEPTPVIGAGPPSGIEYPEIQGESVVGKRLRATEGVWDLGGGTRIGVTYLWQRCKPKGKNCRDVKPATAGNTYLVVPADRGSTMQVVVTMTTTGGSASELAVALKKVIARGTRARPCRVPRLVGKSLTAARKSLSKAKCRLGSVRRTTSRRPVGMIVGQHPKPGTRLRAGGKVSVRVSLGRRR